MTRGVVYDSRKPLDACEHKTLNRQIGVLIQEPFWHKGLNKPTIDVEWETISVNTLCFGKVVETKLWPLVALEAAEKIIADIDKVIDELNAHKERMQAHHEVLSTRGIPGAKLIQPRTAMYESVKKDIDKAVERINTKTESYGEQKDDSAS